ncbi:hypothetical protein E2C01_046880 [Portunus trituberculatus]|uniref:Uncharacterized protein n=1 Tax=Portunus trituberculatus TaxID=210409 RepID=A0A5B7G699_PORTR|nr:hypothetical protein [Portunus trituberculatus]
MVLKGGNLLCAFSTLYSFVRTVSKGHKDNKLGFSKVFLLLMTSEFSRMFFFFLSFSVAIWKLGELVE